MNTQTKIVFLQGKKTILRPLSVSDVERCQQWINDPEVSRFLKSRFPLSLEAERKWLERKMTENDEIVLAIETLEGVHIGNIGIHKIDWVNRVATTGTIIGDKSYWGKGFGTDAKMILLDYIFNTLNLRKVYSAVYAFNSRSLAYAKKCGYVEEGTRREHVFRDGKYWDVIDLAVFKKEWLPYWKRYTNRPKK